MERLAKKLAEKLSDELKFDNEKKAVVEYGLLALLQTVLNISLVLIISLVLGVAVEALIVSLSVMLLRKYSGGAHLGSIWSCSFLGVFYSVSAALVSKHYLSALISHQMMAFVLAVLYFVFYYAIFRLAPVDSPNKPIKSEKKIRRMRKGAFLTLSAYLLISLLLLFFGLKYHTFLVYNLCLLFGIIWQVFTLTKTSAQFFYIMDLVGKGKPNERR